MSTIDYTARLHSTTADKILAHVDELYDTTQSKFQSAINAEVKRRLDSVDGNIADKIGGVYKVKGTKNTIAEVIALTPVIGDVWNVTSEFTLSGKKYPAGTNVVATAATQAESSWDALGGTVDVQDILNKAAADATTKANTAKSEAISAASTDATQKANTAKNEAISTAASDATTKSNAAKEAAIAQAAKDADTKVNAAKKEIQDEVTTLTAKVETNKMHITTLDKITPAFFTEYLETTPPGVQLATITSWPTVIAYDASKNTFLAKGNDGKWYNDWNGSAPWREGAGSNKANNDKVYLRFWNGKLSPYIYHPTQKKLVAVPSDKEAQLEAALQNKLDSATFNSYKSSNDSAVQSTKSAATQAQQSVGALARKVGAFDYSMFQTLQAKVTELENLLKLV